MAANPLRGEAAIKVGDTAYSLALDVNAFCYAQSVLSMKPLEMVSAFLADGDDLLLMRTLLWAALQRHHPCHELEAGDILADVGPVAVRAAITGMMVAAFGLKEQAEDKEPGKEPKTEPILGTGSGSTASTAKPGATAKRSGRKRPA
ncbi:MAG: hypothetical protein V4523_07850 [Pseudomonadota bacterium]